MSNGTCNNSLANVDSAVSAGRILAVIFMCVVVILTLIGNSLVIISVRKFRRLRSQVCFHFLASLAGADIAVAILVMSGSVIYVAYGVGCWPLGWIYCYFWISCDVMCCTASILHLCVISLDRYVAVTRSLTYQQIMTPKRVILAVCIIWLLSIIISFGPIYLGWFAPNDQNLTSRIYTIEVNGTCDLQVNRVYAIISSSTSFFLPFGLMTFAYARIYKIALHQAAQIRRQAAGMVGRDEAHLRHETKAIKTLGLIVGSFSICWMPFFLMYIILPFCGPNCPMSHTWVFVITWIGYCNSALNPVLYCFNQREFRASFRQLLCCRGRQTDEYYLCTDKRYSTMPPQTSTNGHGGALLGKRDESFEIKRKRSTPRSTPRLPRSTTRSAE